MDLGNIQMLNLKATALCRICGTKIALEKGRLGVPEHTAGDVLCEGSGYSPKDESEAYEISSKDQAVAVAKLLASDDGGCLYYHQHSISCADGKFCNQQRRMLASALANYFLMNN